MNILAEVFIFGCLLLIGFYTLVASFLDLRIWYRMNYKRAKHAWPNPKKLKAVYYGAKACISLALATVFGFLFVCSLFIFVLEILPRLF